MLNPVRKSHEQISPNVQYAVLISIVPQAQEVILLPDRQGLIRSLHLAYRIFSITVRLHVSIYDAGKQ